MASTRKKSRPPPREITREGFMEAEFPIFLADHPGTTRAEYVRLFGTDVDEDDALIRWRIARAKAADRAMRLAWLRDHPGEEPLPEHACGWSARAIRWLDQYQHTEAASMTTLIPFKTKFELLKEKLAAAGITKVCPGTGDVTSIGVRHRDVGLARAVLAGTRLGQGVEVWVGGEICPPKRCRGKDGKFYYEY